MKTIIFLGLIFILASSAHPGPSKISKSVPAKPRLVGGEEAVPHSIPYQVALYNHLNICGGSLISDKWVLTSASCGLQSSKPNVILGAHRVKEEEDTQVILTGTRVIIHEEYDEKDSYRNDIAVVELPVAVTMNENIQTVALASRKAGAFIGQLAQASGWGSGNIYNNTVATALRYFNSTVISNVECQKVYGVGTNVYMTKMCLAGSEGNTCDGDYGGPLVIKNEDGKPVQFGISTAVGDWGTCHALYPPAFTRVSSYIDWIEEKTGLVLP